MRSQTVECVHCGTVHYTVGFDHISAQNPPERDYYRCVKCTAGYRAMKPKIDVPVDRRSMPPIYAEETPVPKAPIRAEEAAELRKAAAKEAAALQEKPALKLVKTEEK